MSPDRPSDVAPDGSELRIIGLPGLPEVHPGDNVPTLVCDALSRSGLGVESNDVLVVTHKIVSKAEGRLVDLKTVTPSAFAQSVAARYDKDARQIEVVLQESVRIVRMERGVLITETAHGFICANAGVDASNVAPDTVCLLPVDPDASAQRIADAVRQQFLVSAGVIVSDSFGRPWRNGIVNVAIGVSGMAPLADYRGMADDAGYELHVSVLAVADELAAAAELVMHKLDRRPVVLVRGYQPRTRSAQGSGRDLIMDSTRDLFR